MSRIRIERPAASRLPVTSTNRICGSQTVICDVEPDSASGRASGPCLGHPGFGERADVGAVVRGPGTLSADASVGSLMPPTPYPAVLSETCRCRDEDAQRRP